VRSFSLLLFIIAAHSADASEDLVVIKKPDEIRRIIDKIPARGSDLGLLLPRIGLQVSYVTVSQLDAEDANESGGMYRAGDRLVDIVFAEPLPHTANCPIISSASFLVRKGKYHPESRTANWLLTRKCVVPD
jgi:hypothetical protein